MQNLIEFHQLFKNILSRNKTLTITKGHNSVVNFRKLTHKNTKVDLVNVEAYTKFDLIPGIRSQDKEHK